MRITERDLENVITRLNKITNSPETTYRKENGKLISNVGNYHLSGAYGGWKLERICNEQGGVTTPIHSGYVSKRELYNLIHSYINGVLSAQGNN
jgi:hypothetical protein